MIKSEYNQTKVIDEFRGSRRVIQGLSGTNIFTRNCDSGKLRGMAIMNGEWDYDCRQREGR